MILLGVMLGFTLLFTGNVHGMSVTRRSESQGDLTGNLLPALPTAQPVGLDLGFAMADFTGDTHPDLATVALNRFDSANAQYVIEIRLTEGGHQFLRLTAPFGGLLIMPKDVTGDGNQDLVIRSAPSRNVVAVFLNNGYGHFVAADPNAFRELLREATPEQEVAPEHFHFSATLVCPKPYAINFPCGSVRALQKQGDSTLSASYVVARDSFLLSGLDRAPPAVA
jgi:hypothetical protein